MAKKHHVSFTAEKKISVPKKVSFRTEDGTKVTFKAHKTVKKPVRVSFDAK